MIKYKTGILLFLFLSSIITLFPPFNWGDELLKTKEEREDYKAKYLPIKEYSFIFGGTSKYFIVDKYAYQKTQRNNIPLSPSETIDVIKIDVTSSADTTWDINFVWVGNRLKDISHIKSITPLKIYSIIKPKYLKLSRSMLILELFLEYVLAFILSIMVQIFIITIKNSRGNDKL